MRITFFLMFLSFVQVSASVYAQNTQLKIHVKNAKVSEVFDAIKKQSEFDFLYRSKLVSELTNVDLEVDNATIAEVLGQILPSDLMYETHDKTIIIRAIPKPTAPMIEERSEVDISGKITDENGEGLPGANVLVKGTTNGIITDLDGFFQLTVEENDILVISFVGYLSQEIAVRGRQIIDLELIPDIAQLDEIVKIGYGEQKKANVTGAIVSIESKELTQSPVANLSNALVGRLPGLIATQRSGEPGADGSNLLIRGISTTGNSAPLVIVDGIQRAFSQLDPNEIESITILKDASAAAVYGVRGANGVILVTTKRGRTGPPSISYTAEFSTQQPTRLPKFLGSYDYARLLNEANTNEGKPEPFSEEDLELYKSGASPDTHPDTDWLAEGLKSSAPQMQHSLSISGGSEKVGYFASVGYLDQKGLFENAEFKRFNFRLNTDIHVTDDLTISMDISGRNEKRAYSGTSTGAIYAGLVRTPPIYTPYYSNGLPSAYRGNNPIEQMKNTGYVKSDANVLTGSLKGEYKIPFIEGLSIQGIASIDRMHRFSKSFTKPYTYYTLQGTDYVENSSGGAPSLSESYFTGPAPSNSGIPDPTTTLNAMINYDQTFGSHSVQGLLGVEKVFHKSNGFSASARDFISDQDYFASGDVESHRVADWENESTRLGYFGRINYSFNSKYLVEVSFRQDASSNFHKDSRWGFFPSMSLGWRISEESFMSGVKIIDDLKVRASYGQLGNDRISPYQYLSSYSFSSDVIFGGTDPKTLKTIAPGVIPNEQVGWEIANIMNVGFNLGLIESKVTMEFDYFMKNTTQILGPNNKVYSYSLGVDGRLASENIIEVDNKGFELSLGYEDNFGALNYWVKGNFTKAVNNLVFYPESADINENVQWTGRPINSIFGYRALGLFQSNDEIANHADQNDPSLAPGDIKYEDIDGNGVIDSDDRVAIGRNLNNPGVVYGFSFGAEYKGFDISLLFQGADDFNVYLSEEAAWAFYNEGKALEQHLDSWRPNNPNASYPRVLTEGNNNRKYSSYWLRNAAYLRLKNVEIGYAIPSSILDKAGISNVRVYASGLNLYTWSGLETFDPEVPSGRGRSYPQHKLFTLGVTVTL